MKVTLSYRRQEMNKPEEVELTNVRSIRESESHWRFHLNDGMYVRYEKEATSNVRVSR
jgi:hypothetical protein